MESNVINSLAKVHVGLKKKTEGNKNINGLNLYWKNKFVRLDETKQPYGKKHKHGYRNVES